MKRESTSPWLVGVKNPKPEVRPPSSTCPWLNQYPEEDK
jgi:hypothetical protein